MSHVPSINPQSATVLRTAPAHRTVLRWLVVQGSLWSLGNALTTGFLVTFMALELGAKPLAISITLALQSIAGVLRLGTPWLVSWFGSTRRTCLVTFGMSYAVIALLPLAPLWGDQWQVTHPVAVMIAVLSVHQLFEYLGSVALWSWLGELVPRPVRGRFFGRRNLWQLVCVIGATLASGPFVDWWKQTYTQPSQQLWGYAIVLAVGALALLGSLVPLVFLPKSLRRRKTEFNTIDVPRLTWSTLLTPWRDRRYRTLLLFIVWFSFSNGLTQTAQNIFPKAILQLSLTTALTMVTVMRVGQAALSPWLGRLSDRLGNRPVLVVCQVCIAVGLSCYGLASPAQPQWLWGAWLLWIAFAGHNICLFNLMLKLAPPTERTSYVAVYLAVSGATLALSTLAGGWLLDHAFAALESWQLPITRPQWFATVFVVGAVLRLAGAVFATQIDESPVARGATNVRQLI